MSEFAYTSLTKEYGQVWSNLNIKIRFKTPVEKREKNKLRLTKAVETMDMLALLRSHRRPLESVVNLQLTLDFFKSISKYEIKLKKYTHDLEIGLGKANRGKNPIEKRAVPLVKKKPLKKPKLTHDLCGRMYVYPSFIFLGPIP